jgi:hypothetical protein
MRPQIRPQVLKPKIKAVITTLEQVPVNIPRSFPFVKALAATF